MVFITNLIKRVSTHRIAWALLPVVLVSVCPAPSYAQAVVTDSTNAYHLPTWRNENPVIVEKQSHAQQLKLMCHESFTTRAQCAMINAFTWLGAHSGLVDEQDKLANFYYFAVFSEKPQTQKAIRWYKRAARQGSSLAQYKLYAFFSDQELREASVLKPRIQWLTESAEKQFSPAQFELGYNLYKGSLVEKNTDDGISLMHRASLAGNQNATNKLTEIYMSNLKTLKDYEKADSAGKDEIRPKMSEATAIVSYFIMQSELSAEQGGADEQFELAMLFHNGENFYKDDKKAFRWMKSAAQANDRRAQLNLGIMYFQALGTQKNNAKAFQWISTAAKQDYPIAQFFLATLYTDGQGVEKDSAKAAELLQKAAQGGVITANSNLASLYESGQGVPKDPAMAESLRSYVYSKNAEIHKDFAGLVSAL